MATVFDTAEQQRRALERREREALGALTRAYGQAWRQLQQRLSGLLQAIEAAQARGEPINPAWLLRQERYRALLEQVHEELRRLQALADATIRETQAWAVETAPAHAEALTRASMGTPPPGITVRWNTLPRGAVEALVGMTAEGSPLTALLAQAGQASARAITDALIVAVATGQGPKAPARLVRAAWGSSLQQALTLTRTAMLNSYRVAAQRSFRANRDLVTGWIWHARLDTRTCPVCWAMHGSVHDLDEPFGGHYNCRCAMLPKTRTWRELGFDIDEIVPPVPTGAEQFARLSADQQRAILGPGKYALYRRGDLKLADLVGVRNDPVWGPMRVERSLTSLQRG